MRIEFLIDGEAADLATYFQSQLGSSARVEAKLDQLLQRVEQIQIQENQEMQGIASLTAQVSQNTTVIGSAKTLIEGFNKRLNDAIEAAQTGDNSALLALSAEIKASDDALAAAVAANTPAAQPIPVEQP